VSAQTRWVTDNGPDHAQWYIERFRTMAADGEDLAGEARLVDAMVPRAARVLDAGCGTGRVGAELAARGHSVVGVDADAQLFDAANADHPGPRWLVADLSELDLTSMGVPELFDAAVMAGNVMVFVAPGTESVVLTRVGAHVREDGFVIVGFGTDRGYEIDDFDDHVRAAGLFVEQRFATWYLRPWTPDSSFAVTYLRHVQPAAS
jgi:SAM-dependent methyltransferase